MQISVDHLIQFLNDLLDTDRHAVQELLAARVPCNRAMADHPSVQVAAGGERGTPFVPPNQYRLGLLGLINGLFGTIAEGERSGWGWITAEYEEGVLVRFRKTEGAA